MKKYLVLFLSFFLGCCMIVDVSAVTMNLIKTKAEWDVMVHEGNSLSIEKKKDILVLDYQMPIKGQWVQITKDVQTEFKNIKSLIIEFKGTGPRNSLEIKLEDENGSFFGTKLMNITKRKKYKKIRLGISQFQYWWGGDKRKDNIKKVYIAIAGRGNGTLEIKKLELDTIKPIKTKASELQGFLNQGKVKDIEKFRKYQLEDHWDDVSLWQTSNDEGSRINLDSYNTVFGKGIKADYTLKSGGGGWVILKKTLDRIPSEDTPITFLMRALPGSDFEVKFVDEDGSVFGRKFLLTDKYKEWTPVVIYNDSVEYWWGGDSEFSRLKHLELALSGRGKGVVLLDEIGLGNKDMQATFRPAGPQLDPDRELKGFGFKQRRARRLKKENRLVLKWLKKIQDISSKEKALLPSMEGNVAHTFNNSLVAMAFMLKKQRKRAERILDYYAKATVKSNADIGLQNFYYNDEARGFYQQVFLRDEGDNKAYHQTGSSDRWMGDMCWLLTAYKYHQKRYKSKKYNKIIKTLKDLLLSWYKEDPKTGGGYLQHGWRKGDAKLHEDHGHPEGNIDAYAVMKLIGEHEKAEKIKIWLESVLNGNNLPLDLYTWRVLAFGKESADILNIPEYDLRFRKIMKKKGKNVMGVYHAPDINVDNIWLDGTGHIACAYFAVGNKHRGNFYSNQLDHFLITRVIKGVKTKTLPYTAISAGDYEWVDQKKGFVSVVAWYIFAKNRFNPMTLEKY